MIFAYAPSDQHLKEWRAKFNAQTTNCAEDMFTKFKCNVLMICVNPRDFWTDIMMDLRKAPFERIVQDLEPIYIISAAPGVTMEQLKKAIPSNASQYVKYYRIITSIACSLSQSACGIYTDTLNGAEYDAVVQSLCSWFGSETYTGIYVDREDLLDAVTGVSESGLGFCFEFIQAMSDGGVACGLTRDQSTICAAQTLIGAGMMVLNTGRHPIQLRDMVCSPAGTAIAGIRAMDARSVRLGIREAVEASAKRSQEAKWNANWAMNPNDGPDWGHVDKNDPNRTMDTTVNGH